MKEASVAQAYDFSNGYIWVRHTTWLIVPSQQNKQKQAAAKRWPNSPSGKLYLLLDVLLNAVNALKKKPRCNAAGLFTLLTGASNA